MSLTCQHSIADAPNHPECQGCRGDRVRRTWAHRPDPRPRPDHLLCDRLIIDDPWCPSLLPDRPLTPEEIVARSEDPRPGVWAGEASADLRGLTQEQTDVLIRFELINFASHPGERDDVLAVVGSHTWLDRVLGKDAIAQSQRGGIDSDPMVRLLAFRAWGDRDRRWFELRGVRAGETVHMYPCRAAGAAGNLYPDRHPLVARRHAGETQTDMAMSDAGPGQLVVVDTVFGDVTCRVSDRLRAGDLQVDHVGDLLELAELAADPPALRTEVVSPAIYRLMIEQEIRRGLDAGVSRRRLVAHLLDTGPESRRMIDAEVRRRDLARRPRIEELTVRLGLAAEPVFEPGARAPGVKPSPPVPPWARKRRMSRRDDR